jgi:hypothetical protein
MELIITYIIAHGCLVAVSWLSTHAENCPIPAPNRYLGSTHITPEVTIEMQKTRFWM